MSRLNCLTLFQNNEFSIKLRKIKSGLSIVYIEWSYNIFRQTIVFHSLKTDFVLANSADPDELPLDATFYLGLHCLPKYLLTSIQNEKG